MMPQAQPASNQHALTTIARLAEIAAVPQELREQCMAELVGAIYERDTFVSAQPSPTQAAELFDGLGRAIKQLGKAHDALARSDFANACDALFGDDLTTKRQQLADMQRELECWADTAIALKASRGGQCKHVLVGGRHMFKDAFEEFLARAYGVVLTLGGKLMLDTDVPAEAPGNTMVTFARALSTLVPTRHFPSLGALDRVKKHSENECTISR